MKCQQYWDVRSTQEIETHREVVDGNKDHLHHYCESKGKGAFSEYCVN